MEKFGFIMAVPAEQLERMNLPLQSLTNSLLGDNSRRHPSLSTKSWFDEMRDCHLVKIKSTEPTPPNLPHVNEGEPYKIISYSEASILLGRGRRPNE